MNLDEKHYPLRPPSHVFQRAGSLVLTVTFCAVAVWRGMQALAIVALVLSVALIYKHHTKTLVGVVTGLLRSTRQAKWGDLEFLISQNPGGLSELLVQKASLTRILLDGLDSDHLGWLFTLNRAGRYRPNGIAKDKLRPLRDKGLVAHDAPAMSESSEVWLTDLGQQLVRMLIASIPELQATAEGHQRHQNPAPPPRET